jgi:hypothetical protein
LDGQVEAIAEDGLPGARIAEVKTTVMVANAALRPTMERSERRMIVSPMSSAKTAADSGEIRAADTI